MEELELTVIVEKVERFLSVPLKTIEEVSDVLDHSYNMEANYYNGIFSVMNQDLNLIKRHLQGEQTDVDELVETLRHGRVPRWWEETSKALGSWVNFFFERIQMFQKWESLKCYNLSLFERPQFFLKLVKREKYYTYEYTMQHFLEVEERPKSGVFLYGIKLVGARYNEMTKKFKLLAPFEFYSEVPLLYLGSSN